MATGPGWKTPFTKGVGHFRAGEYQDAIDCFSEALAKGGDGATIYDSRAAVYQKLGKLRDALSDAKAAIDLQPDHWKGYARSARLFLQARKYDAATRMVELALERLPPEQSRQREDMTALRTQIDTAQGAARKLLSERTYHFGKLPVEIAATMFSMVLEENHAYVVVLAQVCKNWRATVLGTPAFWGTLVLGKNRTKRKVKLWRERARDRFHHLVMLEAFTESDFRPTLQELSAVTWDTLRVLEFQGSHWNAIRSQLPSLDASAFASLDSLTLQFPPIQSVKLCLDDTPSFAWHHLRLANAYVLDSSELAKRLTGLESLAIDNCPMGVQWNSFLHILHRNPKIARLELANMNPASEQTVPGDEEEAPSVITLPHVARIDIKSSDVLANILLPRLITPSLEALHISMHRQRLVGCMSRLAAGQATRLTSLSIQRSPITAAVLIDVLTAATALESLQVTHVCDVAPRILKFLVTPIETTASSPTRDDEGVRAECETDEPVRHIPCPALRHIDLSHCTDLQASPLIALVKSRQSEAQEPAADADDSVGKAKISTPQVRPLESIVIDGCPKVDADVLPWLRAKVPYVSCVYLTKKNATWKR
ncbi:hypothetical protein GY45DRAFT_1255590 [Cubamyces sp. BRFM 1775]|nr:hypothetical protein GY45DRAFT_1255590 [Cubamyces sp. BRFM 1775]